MKLGSSQRPKKVPRKFFGAKKVDEPCEHRTNKEHKEINQEASIMEFINFTCGSMKISLRTLAFDQLGNNSQRYLKAAELIRINGFKFGTLTLAP